MTKKFKRSILVFATAAFSLGGIVGCNKNNQNFGNKAVVYVWNFKGGFGGDWLTNVIEEYEALHKDDVYGDKVGVHFEVTNNKKEFNASDLVTYDMFFLETANYSDYVASDAIEDITEAVTGENPYEPGKTLLSKFTDSQKEFYKTQGDKYFGVPHYSGTYGITYDAKLFKSSGYYFRKGHEDVKTCTNKLTLFTDDLDNLAYGPDGKTGIIDGVDYSYDDGLPETFDEFYALCDRIKIDEVSPLEFAGDSNQGGYISSFTTSLMNNLMGGSQAMLNYKFEGSLEKSVKFTTKNGVETVVTDDDGNAVLEDSPVSISANEGYNVYKSEGRYDAIRFTSNIFQNKRYNPHIEGDHSYTTAENEFIMGEKLSSQASINRSAMLIDGSWWQTEAKSTFESMNKKFPGQGQSVMDRDFRFMPLPKAKSSDEYHQTYTDSLNALQCLRKGVDAQAKEICIDFLQFINTDEQLVKFSQTTNTTRSLKYSMTDEELNSMSPYGRSLFKYKNHADTEIIYPISGTSQFVNGMSAFFTPQYGFKSADRNFLTNWYEAGNYNAAEILPAIYKYYSSAWRTL